MLLFVSQCLQSNCWQHGWPLCENCWSTGLPSALRLTSAGVRMWIGRRRRRIFTARNRLAFVNGRAVSTGRCHLEYVDCVRWVAAAAARAVHIASSSVASAAALATDHDRCYRLLLSSTLTAQLYRISNTHAPTDFRIRLRRDKWIHFRRIRWF